MSHIEHRIKISIEELIANKSDWESMIDTYVEIARDNLKYEIFLNGEIRIEQYMKKKKGHISTDAKEVNIQSKAFQKFELNSQVGRKDEHILVLTERLQAIIDWCDIAMKNADEFDSHGVRNLDGPIFDAAREILERKS